MSEHEGDGYAERVRRALGGQLAPKAQDGGVRMLCRCGMCGHAWLRDGRRAAPRPSAEQLARLVVELHADPDHLPRGTCPICDATLAGMELTLDGYHDRNGSLQGIGVSQR
jgi:hypothetical protein